MPTQRDPRVALAVDLVLLAPKGDGMALLVIERGKRPFQAMLALPGGFVEPDEDLPTAARRELAEETGIDATTVPIRQCRVYGAPDRDPRGRVVSVSYQGFLPTATPPTAGSDAATARWMPLRRFLSPDVEIAFDHRQIVLDALRDTSVGNEPGAFGDLPN